MRNGLWRTVAVGGVLALTACAGPVTGTGSLAARAPNPGSGFPSTSASPAGTANAALAPSALAAAARTALTTATAFRMKGAANDSGMPLAFDVHYGKSSSDGSLNVYGAAVKLRYVAPKIYLMGARPFWQMIATQQHASAQQAKVLIGLLADKWVHIPTGTPGLSDMASFAVRDQFVRQLAGGPDSSTYTRGPSKTVDGIAAVSFVADDGTIVFVPARGKPYPIRVENHGSDGGAFDLSDWDVPFTASSPPAGTTVELPH